MSISADPRIGSVLAGYRLEALLGQGGMGVVYRAHDEALDRSVALKLISPALASDTDFRDRFLVEARLAASLDHPNVIPVYDAGDIDGQLYLAMRYVEGTDLRELLAEEEQFGLERALAICGQVAQALDAARRKGLVHQDVKPSNVLLDEDGHAYLADFGLTRRLADQAPGFEAGLSLGTPAYVAPEQIRGADVDGRADQYSLACVLYECLTGKQPFGLASELATLYAHLEHEPPEYPGLEAVFTRALAKEPDERYDSCTAFIDAARAALLAPRRRRLLAAAVAALLAIAVAAILAVVLTRSDTETGPDTTPTLTPATDSIQRIDPETNQIVATIAAPVSRGELTIGGRLVWTADVDKGLVARIDPERNAVVETISGIGDPTGIASTGDAVFVYNASDGIVTQLDAERGVVIATIPLPQPGIALHREKFHQVVANENEVWLQWASDDGNAVRIVPSSIIPSNTRATPVQIGPSDRTVGQLVLSASLVWTQLLPSYIASQTESTSRVGLQGFDPQRPDRGEPAIPLPGEVGWNVCLLAAGDYVWVADFEHGFVLQIDPRRQNLVRRITVGNEPCGMAIASGSLWVANGGDGTVTRMDAGSGEVIATIDFGPGTPGTYAGIAADENAVWVDVHPDEPAVSP